MNHRLLLVSNEFPPGPGGIGTQAYQLAAHLSRRGWEVTALTPQDHAAPDEVEAFNAAQGFCVRTLRRVRGTIPEAARRFRALRRAIREGAPAAILATGDRAVWITAAAVRASLPWIAIGHGMEFGTTVVRDRLLTRWAFEHASEVVCVSRYTERRMEEAGIRPRAVRVIENGADERVFTRLETGDADDIRRSLGLGGALLLLTVGNVWDRKGQDIVIRALPRVLAAEANAFYLMAGLPTEAGRFAELAGKLGVGERVRFLGRTETKTLVKLMNACEVFVMTSRHTNDGDFEGYGIAVVEAALCGKPAIVSADSGLSEAIEDGRTGIAVREEDPEATAAAIIELLRDPVRRRAMGEAARSRAIRSQTWSARVDQYEAVLDGMLQPGRLAAGVRS